MVYMDLAVHCLRKAVNLIDCLQPRLIDICRANLIDDFLLGRSDSFGADLIDLPPILIDTYGHNVIDGL